MKKNLLLQVAAIICMILCVCTVLLFLLHTAVFIYWHIQPEFFSIFSFPEVIPHHTSVGITIKEQWYLPGTEKENAFSVNNIRFWSLYLNFIQVSAIFLFTFLSLKEFLKIIRSVRLTQTFHKRNADSFRTIGRYLVVVFILSSFLAVFVEQGAFFGFYFHVTPLVLLLIAFIMAEIFSEGNMLLEENQFTV